jgi:hypothetical protein
MNFLLTFEIAPLFCERTVYDISRLRVNASVTAPWISATSANWSLFNFIFNLGNRKQSGGDTSGEYGC